MRGNRDEVRGNRKSLILFIEGSYVKEYGDIIMEDNWIQPICLLDISGRPQPQGLGT